MRPLADRALVGSTGLWFLATVVGQWIFLFYVAAYYGPPTLTGHFEAWNRHQLYRGFVPGDAAGNATFASHVLLANIILFGGGLQLVPQIRKRAIAVHRWVGRLFLLASMGAALGGLYMVWVRGATPGIGNALAVSLESVLIFSFAILSWRAPPPHDVAVHRRWALRAFMVANGVFFVRVGARAWFQLTHIDADDVFYLFDFASYLIPLALLELYLYTKKHGSELARFATAGVVLASAAFLSVGAVGLYSSVLKKLAS